jgi:hypothetical protein
MSVPDSFPHSSPNPVAALVYRWRALPLPVRRALVHVVLGVGLLTWWVNTGATTIQAWVTVWQTGDEATRIRIATAAIGAAFAAHLLASVLRSLTAGPAPRCTCGHGTAK